MDDLISDLIDRLCDRFEAEWRAGLRPRIETFLARAPAEARNAMLRAIVPVELELLRTQGKSPSREDYCDRFPEHLTTIEVLFEGEP